MESSDQATKKALDIMKSIQTLDDLKEHKDEIIELIEQFIKLGVESLKGIIKLALSPEETKKELDKFQETQEYFNDKWESEMERIASIEGAKEF